MELPNEISYPMPISTNEGKIYPTPKVNFCCPQISCSEFGLNIIKVVEKL